MVDLSRVSISSAGFRDGLGERLIGFDRTGGRPLELLRVRPELAALETALVARLDVLASFKDQRFQPLRGPGRDPASGQLLIVSEQVEGERLSEVLARAQAYHVIPDITIAIYVVMETLLALAALEKTCRTAHGAVGLQRIVVTPRGRVVVADHMLAPLIERLKLSPGFLWREMRLAMPGKAASPRFDARADIAQTALMLVACSIGRPLQEDEHPDRIPALANEVKEIARIRGGDGMAEGLQKWLGGTLPTARRFAYADPAEARFGLQRALPKEGGILGSQEELASFLAQVDAAERGEAEAEAAPAPAVPAARKPAPPTVEVISATAVEPVVTSPAPDEAITIDLDAALPPEPRRAPDDLFSPVETHVVEPIWLEETTAPPEPAPAPIVEPAPPPIAEAAPAPISEAAPMVAAEPAVEVAPIVEAPPIVAAEPAIEPVEAPPIAAAEPAIEPVPFVEAPSIVAAEPAIEPVEAPPMVVAEPAIERAIEPAPSVGAPPIVPEPLVEPAPVVEAPSIVAAEPAIEPAPVVAAAPPTEPAPVAEAPSIVVAEPAIEPAPVVEEPPIVAEEPVIEAAPVVETLPIVAAETAVERASEFAEPGQLLEPVEVPEVVEAPEMTAPVAESPEVRLETPPAEPAVAFDRQELGEATSSFDRLFEEAEAIGRAATMEAREAQPIEAVPEPATIPEPTPAPPVIEPAPAPIVIVEPPPVPSVIEPAPAPAAVVEPPFVPPVVEPAPAPIVVVKPPPMPQVIEPAPAPVVIVKPPQVPPMVEPAPAPAAVVEPPFVPQVVEPKPQPAIVAEPAPAPTARIEAPPPPEAFRDFVVPAPTRIEPLPARPAAAQVAEPAPAARIHVEAPPAAEAFRDFVVPLPPEAEPPAPPAMAKADEPEAPPRPRLISDVDLKTIPDWMLGPEPAPATPAPAPADGTPPPVVEAPPSELGRPPSPWSPRVEMPAQVPYAAAPAAGGGAELVHGEDAGKTHARVLLEADSRRRQADEALEALEEHVALEARSRAEVRRRVARLAVLGIVGAIATAAAVAGFRYWERNTQPGTVVVESVPPGSEVLIDGEARGQTPVTLTLPPGAHVLELRRGERTSTINLDVQPGAGLTETIDWKKTFDKGTLEVTSEPDGARVVIAGKSAGKTPLTLKDLPVGRYTVVVQSSRGAVTNEVLIRRNETTTLHASVYSGWLAVFSPIELKIFERGRLIGTSTDGRLMVPPGRHEVELSNEELGYRTTETFTVKPGQVASVSIEPKGQVNVNATPWAEVFVDGQRLGDTPLANVRVTIGTHEFVFRHPELGERRLIVTVTLKETAHVDMDMTRRQ